MRSCEDGLRQLEEEAVMLAIRNSVPRLLALDEPETTSSSTISASPLSAEISATAELRLQERSLSESMHSTKRL